MGKRRHAQEGELTAITERTGLKVVIVDLYQVDGKTTGADHIAEGIVITKNPYAIDYIETHAPAASNRMNRITAVFMRKGGADMGGRGGSSHRTSAGRTSSAFDFLRRAYGENHVNAVLAILQNAPEHIRSMWDDFSSQFRVTRMGRNERGAFYAPADGLGEKTRTSGLLNPIRKFWRS